MQLAFQAFADLAAGDVLAVPAGQRRGIDQEIHGQRGLVHFQQRQAFRFGRIAEGDTDGHFFDAIDQHDVPGLGFFDNGTLEALEHQHLIDPGHLRLAIRALHDGNLLAGADASVRYPTDADSADETGIVKRADLQLQRRIGIGVAHPDMLQDRVEQGTHVRARLAQVESGITVQGRSVNNREIELFLGRAELVEQIEGLVHDPIRTRARAIHLVDHDDGLESEGQRLARDKTGLRHRTFHRIDQQQHAFHHRQHALDLAAEIGVSGGIDNVDVRAFVLDGAVLRQDRDAAFLFQVIGVHDPLCDMLMRGKRAGLAQKFVDQRGLAVVDVGNNGDVANVACHGKQCGEKGRAVYHGKGCNSLNFRIMLLPTRDAQKNGPNRVLYPTK